MDLAVQEGAREAAASYQAARGVWEAVCGNVVQAKKNAMAALEISNGREVQYAAGLALALSGDSSRSEALADDLEKGFPEDTFAKFSYAPVLRALSALARGKPVDSVERLQIALPYELAVNGLNFNSFLGGLHSAHVRGEALVPRTGMRTPPPSFRRSSIIVGSSAWIPSAHWRTCNWGERSRSPGTRSRPNARMAIFSLFGKTPTPTFRSWCKRRRSTPGCSSASFRTSLALRVPSPGRSSTVPGDRVKTASCKHGSQYCLKHQSPWALW